MSKPIKIEYLADVAQYLRETKKVEVSTEDIADALVATSHDAQDLERKLSKAMRDAAKDTEVLERAIKDLPKATEDAADKADKDFDRMGDSARDAGRDMGGDFRQSLGEGLSSGGDLSEVISETLGEAVGAAPLPIAAIAGLAVGAWAVLKAESEKQKQELSELFDITDLITGALDKTALMEEAIADLGGGDLQTGLDKVKETAEALGAPIGDVTAMLTGETSPAIEAMLINLRQQNRELNKNWIETGKISDENRALLDAGELIIHQHDEQAAGLKLNAERTNTWQQGYVGVHDAVVDIEKSLGKVDVNMDGIIDKTDDLALKAADTNMDGYVDSIEAAKAGITDAITKAKDLDQIQFTAKTIPVKFDFSDPFWAKQFSDPTSTYYNPGHSAIADSYRRNNQRSG